MKKILLISNCVMHYRSRIYNAFFDMFAEQGYEFHVLSNDYQQVNFPIRYIKHDLSFGSCRYMKAIKEIKPDVCINFLHLKDKMIIPLTFYCRLRGIPMIYWNHGINLHTPDAKVKNGIFHFIHTISSAIILYSPEQLKYISKRNRKKTFIAKNTLDFSDVDIKGLRTPEDVKAFYGIKEKHVVMYISRILPYKGLDVLLRLFKDTPDIGLVVVGGGINENQQEIIVSTPHYYYLGEKYGNEVDEVYQMGDVFSTPGHIGLALNQAMFWGKPVVLLNRRHAPEIVYLHQGYNGFIVETEEELKQKIEELCRNEELYNCISAQARSTYEHEMQIKEMFHGFEQAIEYVSANVLKKALGGVVLITKSTLLNKKYVKETIKYALRSKYVIGYYIKEVERLYAMTPEELRNRNEKRLVKILRKAYDRSTFYQKLYAEAGVKKEDINSLDDIGKRPIVTKEMIKAHAEEMLTEPKWKLLKNHTSGTTGTPLMVYESCPSVWWEQAYFYCYRKRCGYTYGQPIVSLRGNLEKKDTYLKVHISNTLYLSSYNINDKTIDTYYQQIIRHQPVAIEGYPSSLYALALQLRDHGLWLNIPVAFTSSETLLGYQRELIEKQMGTQIFDHYGTTERTIRLSESLNHHGYYEDPGYSINEYTENGEITTSLINDAFPLIRYQGNDVMELMNEKDGNVQLKVKSIRGRNSSYLEGKDGTKYSGALLTRVFKDITTIDNAQFVQKKKGVVDLNVVVGDTFSDEDFQKLRNAVYEQLGIDNFDIQIIKVSPDDIIYTSHGKFNYVLNLMDKH